MSDHRRFRLRVTFCKQGRLAMLSHLELARALERAVRRAQLPFAVSEGFSPHMKIAFGAALPVGVGGEREIFDVQLVRYVAPDRALAALQEASAGDLMVSACAYVEPSASAASVAFPVSSYRAVLSHAPESLPVPDTVELVRKKKTKVLAVADYLVDGIALNGAQASFDLIARPTGSLRPDVLLAACVERYNAEHAKEKADTACASKGLSLAAGDKLYVKSITRIAQRTEVR